MEPKMFCFQCQETAGNKGCMFGGVCGKKPETANLQDLLIYVTKGLSEKKDRTPDEDDMLDMMLHGGERVKAENLSAVLDWFSAQQ